MTLATWRNGRLPVNVQVRMLSHLVPVARGGDVEPTPDEIAAWLDTLPAHDAAATARLLIEKLVVLNRVPAPSRSRLRVLDMMRARAERVRPRLDTALEGAALPLPARAREMAHLLEKLLKELGAGYVAWVLAAPRPWLAIGLRRHLHAPLAAAMHLLAARLALSDRLHARAPGGAWSELHRLYRLARDLGLHDRVAEAGTRAPEAIYVQALLLAFVEPARLMPGEYERIAAYVANFGRLATLLEPPVRGDGRCAFLVDLRRDHPGTAFCKRAETPPPGNRFVLQTRPLVEQAYVHVARLRARVTPATLGLPDDALGEGYPALLAKAGRTWRGERRRRSARMTFRPRVSLQAGFDTAWAALASAVEDDAPHGEWTILNESADGFALRHARGPAPAVAVADIVLVHSRERDARYLCLVRRVQSDGPEHLEIGVQQVGAEVEAAHWLPEIVGEGTQPVFVLPAAGASGARARVVARAGLLGAGVVLLLERRDGRTALQVRRFVERGATVDIAEVDPA
jgi:hypothetical protein